MGTALQNIHFYQGRSFRSWTKGRRVPVEPWLGQKEPPLRARSESVAEHSAGLIGCEERVRYFGALVDEGEVRAGSAWTRVVLHSAWVQSSQLPAALDVRQLPAHSLSHCARKVSPAEQPKPPERVG